MALEWGWWSELWASDLPFGGGPHFGESGFEFLFRVALVVSTPLATRWVRDWSLARARSDWGWERDCDSDWDSE